MKSPLVGTSGGSLEIPNQWRVSHLTIFGGKQYLFQLSAYVFPFSSRLTQLLESLPSPQLPTRFIIWKGVPLKMTQSSCFCLVPNPQDTLRQFLPCHTMKAQAVWRPPPLLLVLPEGASSHHGLLALVPTKVPRTRKLQNKFKLSKCDFL